METPGRLKRTGACTHNRTTCRLACPGNLFGELARGAAGNRLRGVLRRQVRDGDLLLGVLGCRHRRMTEGRRCVCVSNCLLGGSCSHRPYPLVPQSEIVLAPL